MPYARHVDRLVVVVRAPHLEKPGVPFGADVLQEPRHRDAGEAAHHIPALDAEMPGVLNDLRKPTQSLEREGIGARDQSGHLETPAVEIDLRIVDEI